MKRILRALFSLLAVALSLTVVFILYVLLKGNFQKEAFSSGRIQDSSTPFIIPTSTDISAHRLGGGIYPEDTLMAAKGLMEAMERGEYRVDVLEFDLWLTKDDRLILLHDDTLDRTTDAVEHFGRSNLAPGEFTLEELKELNFGESRDEWKGLRGDSIPDDLRACELEELLGYLSDKGDFKFIMETKDWGERGKRAADILAETIVRLGLEDRTMVASFSNEVMDYFDKEYPGLYRTASYSENYRFMIDYLLGRKVEKGTYGYDVLDVTPRFSPFVHTGAWGKLHGLFSLSSQGYINRAHELGIAVYYWTVNDEKVIERLWKRNADGIITDYPDRASRVMGK